MSSRSTAGALLVEAAEEPDVGPRVCACRARAPGAGWRFARGARGRGSGRRGPTGRRRRSPRGGGGGGCRRPRAADAAGGVLRRRLRSRKRGVWPCTTKTAAATSTSSSRPQRTASTRLRCCSNASCRSSSSRETIAKLECVLGGFGFDEHCCVGHEEGGTPSRGPKIRRHGRRPAPARHGRGSRARRGVPEWWEEALYDAIDAFPEYKMQGRDTQRVLGGFGALGNPSSFHNPIIRRYESDAKFVHSLLYWIHESRCQF